MAREQTKSYKRKHNHKHEAERQAQQKSSKSTHSHQHRSKTAQTPKKQSEGIKKPSKSKKTVSAAGVFKRSKRNDKKYRQRKERTPTPERDLTSDFRDGIEEARATIDKTLHATFNDAHKDILHQLSGLRAQDIAFFESISATASMLRAPLGEEQIETTFTRDGKRVTEIVEIGKRVELFKKSVEKDEANLKDYWKQWEDLQDDFVDLGIEVFGPEVFGKAAKEARETGFRREMELLDEEHDAKVLELTGEVEDVAEEFLEKMRESEKGLDASEKRQQTKLLQALIASD